MPVSKPYVYIFIALFISSCSENSSVQNKKPEGGFDYPETIASNDTNFYYYQLKNIESKLDVFRDSYLHLFYKPFNEPNLSIKPQEKETFRLTYSEAGGGSVIISLTEDSIIVKKGDTGGLYQEDTSNLTQVERFHLRFLNFRFPIDTAGKPPRLKKYLDSLTKLYPELLDAAYYHKLYDKALVHSGEKFEYSKTKILITKEQFNSLVEEINSSGYWSFPYQIECDDPPMDGWGFTLEANAKNKYQIVSAIGCPSDTTSFPKICQKIIDLAKMSNEIHLDVKWDIITAPAN